MWCYIIGTYCGLNFMSRFSQEKDRHLLYFTSKGWDLDTDNNPAFDPPNGSKQPLSLLPDLLIMFIQINGCHPFHQKLHCLQLTFQLHAYKQSQHNVKCQSLCWEPLFSKLCIVWGGEQQKPTNKIEKLMNQRWLKLAGILQVITAGFTLYKAKDTQL